MGSSIIRRKLEGSLELSLGEPRIPAIKKCDPGEDGVSFA
jgi:hypothetical protein